MAAPITITAEEFDRKHRQVIGKPEFIRRSSTEVEARRCASVRAVSPIKVWTEFRDGCAGLRSRRTTKNDAPSGRADREMMVPALAGCVTTNPTPIDSICSDDLPMADPGRNNVRYQPTPTAHTIAVGLGC